MGDVLRTALPRLVLSLLMLSGGFFSFFESVYLRDQAAEFGELKIAVWMWVFRAITASLVVGGLLLAISFIRKLIA